MNSKTRRWLSPYLPAKTANSWKQVAKSLVPLYVGVLIVVCAVASLQSLLLFDKIKAVAVVFRVFSPLLLAYAFGGTVYCLLMFRLRSYDSLSKSLFALAIYSPIFGLSIIGALALNSTLFSDWDRFLIWVRVWTPFGTLLGIMATALVVLTFRIGQSTGSAPTTISNRFYGLLEVTTCLAALAFIAAMLFLV